MIDKWCAKAWSNVVSPVQKPSKQIKPWAWIILIVVLLVGVYLSRKLYHRHIVHRDEIVDAIGSIGFIYGAPQTDASGFRIIFFQTSKDGLAIFADDVASGSIQSLREWPDISFMDMHDQVSPLSPDGAMYAYSYNTNGDGPSNYLAICQANSGKELARIDAPEYMNEIVWLTPEKLVWLGRNAWTRAGPGFHLHVVQKQPDGNWVDWRYQTELTNASSLNVLSDETIAWVDDNGLCAMNTTSNNVVKLFEPTGRQIGVTSYSQQTGEFLAPSLVNYSRHTGEFLLTCKDKNNYSLWRLKLNSNAPNDFNKLISDKSIQNAHWINDGKGYAYFNQHSMVIKADATDKLAELVPAIVDTFVTTANGHTLLFVGAVSNEPWAGIWRYDIVNQTLKNIIPYSDYPSAYAIRADPLHCVARLKSGESLGYYVYRPAHFDRHKKYPILIGDTPFMAHINQYSARGPSWAEALADCGAYVVVVDRREWFGGIENWEKDVMAIYNHLIWNFPYGFMSTTGVDSFL